MIVNIEYLQVVLLLRCFGRHFAFGVYERQRELFLWIWRLDGGDRVDRGRTFVANITVCGVKGQVRISKPTAQNYAIFGVTLSYD